MGFVAVVSLESDAAVRSRTVSLQVTTTRIDYAAVEKIDSVSVWTRIDSGGVEGRTRIAFVLRYRAGVASRRQDPSLAIALFVCSGRSGWRTLLWHSSLLLGGGALIVCCEA